MIKIYLLTLIFFISYFLGYLVREIAILFKDLKELRNESRKEMKDGAA